MKKSFLLLLFVIALVSCNSSGEKDQRIVDQIAQAHGLNAFQDAEEIRYTFNVRVNDTLRTSRAWTWRPKEKTATLTTADSTVTYNYETEAAKHETTDQRFINDKYWLLYPFQLAWDDMEYTHEKQAPAPISGEIMQKVTVTYSEGAGYTPGDMYEIYFGEDLILREWVYIPGGEKERAFATTWESYNDLNGLKIATMHRSGDGSFELFITDLQVKR
ncbi:hypothetical protein [Salinimicrobium sp. GXAS 041]|uniref:hypothetical protein n=1 Tax=Salinimicrobium sp. GXAS 041 TaxID=3400806 RepID=UPI003C72E7DA